jgi:signal transduction histidine kinase
METELGSGWIAGVHPDDAAACLATYSDAFDRRQPFTSEYRLRRFDGEYRWMLDTGTPIYDDHDRFVGYIGSAVDISERKASEREREALLAAESAARAEAERANGLKDEFLSILSHELRTPLNAVLGWVHLLRTSSAPAGQLDRGLNVIERNARLQSRMVDDLLDMGGVIAGKMRLDVRPIRLDRVIDGVVESLQPAFVDKGVRLRKEIGTDGLVDGDANRVHQIVWNLLSNALKFTPAEGDVVVALRRCDDAVEIEVQDNGPGIDPEFLPFVFERFRQGDPSTRRSHGGLGIGLALVKSLAELHGGHVTVTSGGASTGSTFTVTLPVREESPGLEASDRAYGTRLEEVMAADPGRSL